MQRDKSTIRRPHWVHAPMSMAMQPCFEHCPVTSLSVYLGTGLGMQHGQLLTPLPVSRSLAVLLEAGLSSWLDQACTPQGLREGLN